MMVTTFESRAQLGLRPPRSRTFISAPRGFTVHYNGPAMGLKATDPHSKCQIKWRQIQNFHMDDRGWVDIAYSCGFCPHGVVLAGRGKGIRTAANGTNSGNDYWYGGMGLVGGFEVPTAAMYQAVLDAAKAFGTSRLVPHDYHKPTQCPGTPFSRWLASGAPSPVTPQEEENMLKRGMSGNAVGALQRALQNEAKHNGRSEPLPDYGPDKDYGEETEEAVKRYQKAAGLTPSGVADGVTMALLMRYYPVKGLSW